MSLYVPPRGGTRGGRDQFKWSDVKADKHRENYLGHSVMAPVGRWQQGRDLQWYSKENATRKLPISAAEELAKVKQAEEDAMMVALGLKKAVRGVGDAQANKEEISRLMANMEKEDLESGIAEEREAEIPIKGLGSKRTSKLSSTSIKDHDIIPGTETSFSQPSNSYTSKMKNSEEKEKKYQSHRKEKTKESRSHKTHVKNDIRKKDKQYERKSSASISSSSHHKELEKKEHRHSRSHKRDRSRSPYINKRARLHEYPR